MDRVLPFKNKLFRFAYRIVGNTAEAEDVVQEVFIKIWQKRSELNQYTNLEAWCMRLTKNHSIDKLRSKHRRLGILPEGLDFIENTAGPHELTERKDTFDRIRKMMEQLPEKQKLVMQLRDIEGFTYKEIAESLEIPLDQVKVNLFRARKQIRKMILKNT